MHLLSCIINQHRYGAQTTTNANNMVNHIVAIGIAAFEKPITSYTFSKTWNDNKYEEIPTLSTVKVFLKEQMKNYYAGENFIDSDKTSELIKWIEELWKENDRLQLKEIYEQAVKDSDAYLKAIKMIKQESIRKTTRTKKEKAGGKSEQKESTEANDESLPDIG